MPTPVTPGHPWMNRLLRLLLKLRNRHFLALDILIALLTPTLALWLRTDSLSLVVHGQSLIFVTAAFLCVKLAVFFPNGFYRRYWRYASIDELTLITAGVIQSTLLQTLIFFVILRPLGLIGPGFPRSLPLLDGLLTLALVGVTRYSTRIAERLDQVYHGRANATRTLIVGAGAAGLMIVREIQSNPLANLLPVGFVDDEPDKLGAVIRGVRVLGARTELRQLLKETRAGLVVIAMPTAPGKVIREIVAVCEQAQAPIKIIPGLYELLDGTVSVNQLRTVQIEDLLRRESVQIDGAAVQALLRGKRVLVTGGGGSIGSELCRQILRCNPAELVILGHGENSVFEIGNELQRTLAKTPRAAPRPLVRSVIADVRFPERLQAIFDEVRPQIVFHAAAHKHVPLMEANPSEAITNNVLGTRNVLAAAQAVGVERFVMISTDKAVNPTSIMGASKRVAELQVREAAAVSGRPYVAVRFGNVLGSRGSVVLTFKQQIAAGGPVTITDPEMTRFFMTIPEAVQLVLQASVLGNGGEVFMLDMGEPVRILDLARDLIELSGLQEGRDIDIVVTGMRPGEKLYEELFVPGETYQPTAHEKIMIAARASQRRSPRLSAAVDALVAAARANDANAIRVGLLHLVPEYTPTDNQDDAPPAVAPPLHPPPAEHSNGRRLSSPLLLSAPRRGEGAGG
ncbi:nucleoside-diphosphate sugar epimerase/dehydratase [Candidatus Amarolinea dominans]|uniref:polysaccharide biosynthesis protein n=1 Tax=Candidatus Amarolinea dominans TaxID=3140696 RepID=UPI0031CC7595